MSKPSMQSSQFRPPTSVTRQLTESFCPKFSNNERRTTSNSSISWRTRSNKLLHSSQTNDWEKNILRSGRVTIYFAVVLFTTQLTVLKMSEAYITGFLFVCRQLKACRALRLRGKIEFWEQKYHFFHHFLVKKNLPYLG